MGILQKQIHSDFTVVHNAFIRDGRLSMAARGLLLTMLSLPDSWNFSIKGLSKILPEGEYAISSTLKKLGEFGYFKRERITGSDGRVVDWSYNFSDEPIFFDQQSPPQRNSPHLKNSDVADGDVEKSDVGNSGVNQINNNKIKNNQIRNDQSLDQSAADNTKSGSLKTIDRIDGLSFTDKQEFDYFLEIVKTNIDYEGITELWKLSAYGSEYLPLLDEVVTLMTDVICSREPTFRVKGQTISHEMIKSRYLSLREKDVTSVIETVTKNETEIKNMQSYLISVLYNAPTTSTANYYAGR